MPKQVTDSEVAQALNRRLTPDDVLLLDQLRRRGASLEKIVEALEQEIVAREEAQARQVNGENTYAYLPSGDSVRRVL